MFRLIKWFPISLAIVVIWFWVVRVIGGNTQTENLYQIELISSLPGTQIRDLTLHNKYFYFEDGWNGEIIRIADVANPAFPEIVGSMIGSYDLVVEGDYGYGLTWGLAIYDMSDPIQPVLLTTFYDLPTYKGESAHVIDLAIYQQTAYVSYAYWIERCYMGGNIAIIDVSDPLNPITVSLMGEPSEWRGRIKIDGNYAYMIGPAFIEVYDITNPHQPKRLELKGGGGEDVFSYTSNMFIVNHELYVTTQAFSTPCFGFPAIWQVWNITDPHYLNPIAIYPNDSIGIMDIADGYIYVWDSGPKVISVVDHANPVFLFDAFSPHSIEVVNGFIYMGHETGVDVLRMSAVAEWVDPAGATTLIYTDTYGLATEIAVPAGTVISPTNLSYLPYPAVDDPPTEEVFVAAFDMVGYGEQFTLERFERPVTVTLNYRATSSGRMVNGEEAHLLRWSGTGWQEAVESCSPAATYWRDPQQFTIRLAVCLPGKYLLMAPAGPLFLPAVLQP